MPERYRNLGSTYSVHRNHERTVRRHFYPNGHLFHKEDFGDKYHDVYISDTSSYMFDESHGRGRDNPLSAKWEREIPVKVRGTMRSRRHYGGSYVETDRDFSITRMVWGSPFMNVIDQDDIAFVTKAVADTNPSSAQVQGLVFLAEFRDVPSLLRSAGHTLAKFGANEYLKVQYGWKPFVSDVKKMVSVTGKIRKRMLLLQRLAREGTARSNYNPKSGLGFKVYKGQEYDPLDYQSDAGTIRIRLDADLAVKRWAQIVWKPETPPGGWWTPSDDDHYAAAIHAVYGLNLDGPSLWQAMPWSWLSDWLSNCNDYIKSQNNSVGGTYKNTVLMRMTTGVITAEPEFIKKPDYLPTTSLSLVGGHRLWREKVRILGLEPQVVRKTDGLGPILGDEFKSSILGALGVQRLRGI